MIGGVLFIIGAALQAGAVHLAMLIVGRIMLGFGVRHCCHRGEDCAGGSAWPAELQTLTMAQAVRA